MNHEDVILFRVKFFETSKDKILEVVVRYVTPSELPGFVLLSDFVFSDQTKHIILPEEEAARKRFNKSVAIHIPYHNVLCVEEFTPEEVDLKNLPFLRDVSDARDPRDHHV